MSSQGVAALLQNIADEEKRAGEESGASPGRSRNGDGDRVAGDGGGDDSSNMDAGSSSSNFEFSSAQPVSTVGDLWGSSGGARASYNRDQSRLSEQPLDTPRREAAERLEVLTATVAAAVAEVAAETYDQSSNQYGFLNASSIATGDVLDTSSEDDADSSSRNPLGALPMAGSRSPKAATAAASSSRPGQRELDSESDQGRQHQGPVPQQKKSSADSSSDGFAGGLPLAGSRSPPPGVAARRVPGRREPDPSDLDSSDCQPPAAAATATATENKSGRRAGRRRQRRSQEVELRQQQQRQQQQQRSAPGRSATLDSFPRHGPGSYPAGSGGGGDGGGGGGSSAGGRRDRDDEYRAEGRLLRSRNRSENSWWEKENTSSDDEEDEEKPGGPAGRIISSGRDRGERRGRQQQQQQEEPGRAGGALLGSTRRPGGRQQPKVAVTAVEARGKSSRRGGAKKSRPRRPPVVWRQVAGGRWAGGTTTVVAGTATGDGAAAAAAVSEEPAPGLRATHFAPGYVGVAWPDPLEAGAATRHLMATRERLLAKLEDASARKIADVEGKSLRARRERAERVKRR